MGFFLKINAIWSNVGIVQKALLLAIVLTFIIAGALGVRWANTPDMGVLYSGLDPEEAGKITEKIGKDIPYELSRSGTTIYVPKEHVAQLRLDMAKEGLPQGSQKGYSIFDNPKIGVSPAVQNINLKRALQDELAKSIQMIDGVVYARVHLVTAKQTLFTSRSGKTTASVVLRLRGGYRLGPSSIAAVTHMVAGAVEGLESNNVTIVNSQGHLLSRPSDEKMQGRMANTVQDYKERVERSYEEKAENMLLSFLGPGRATVKVNAVIDMKSSNTITETPIEGVPKKEEIISSSSIGAGTAGSEGEGPISGGEEKSKTITTELAPGKIITQEEILPGEIKSLTVSVVVDLTPEITDPNATEEAKAAKIMPISQVEELIKNALGLKETDSLTVADVKFYRPFAPLLEEEESGGMDYVAIAGQASLGIMAVCALFVLKIFSGGGKKAKGGVAAGLPAGEVAGLLPDGKEESESAKLHRQITGALQNNPEQVRELFTSWIEE